MRKYEVHWHILVVGTFEVEAKNEEEAMDIAEFELHHNPDFLSDHFYETEADITELIEREKHEIYPQ